VQDAFRYNLGPVSDKKSSKPLAKPAWYKNTYFWIAGVLLVLAIIGMPFLGGDAVIRDPGQKREGWLFLLYLGAAAVMLINGYISHRQTVQHYRETVGETNE
jgi:hypothetical protein